MSGKEQLELKAQPITDFLPTIDSQQALNNSLDTTRLKTELDSIRQFGTPAEKSQAECKIARLIHETATRFHMGQSLISEVLLGEMNIEHLMTKNSKGEVQPPLIITSNNTIELLNFALTDDKIKSPTEGIKPITTTDIIAFARNQEPETDSLTFSFGRSTRTVSKPENKPKIPQLLTLAELLSKEGYPNESAVIYSKLLKIGIGNNTNYNNLGNLFAFFEQHEEIIKVYEEFIKLAEGSTDEGIKLRIDQAKSIIELLQNIDLINRIIDSGYYSDNERAKRTKYLRDLQN